jgi:hypothetical protein
MYFKVITFKGKGFQKLGSSKFRALKSYYFQKLLSKEKAFKS